MCHLYSGMRFRMFYYIKPVQKKDGAARLTNTDVMDIMYDLQCLPIFTDVLPEAQIRQRIYTIAQEHNLSYYDASYLELAHRYNLPLKTYDEDLESAYKKSL